MLVYQRVPTYWIRFFLRTFIPFGWPSIGGFCPETSQKSHQWQTAQAGRWCPNARVNGAKINIFSGQKPALGAPWSSTGLKKPTVRTPQCGHTVWGKTLFHLEGKATQQLGSHSLRLTTSKWSLKMKIQWSFKYVKRCHVMWRVVYALLFSRSSSSTSKSFTALITVQHPRNNSLPTELLPWHKTFTSKCGPKVGRLSLTIRFLCELQRIIHNQLFVRSFPCNVGCWLFD